MDRAGWARAYMYNGSTWLSVGVYTTFAGTGWHHFAALTRTSWSRANASGWASRALIRTPVEHSESSPEAAASLVDPGTTALVCGGPGVEEALAEAAAAIASGKLSSRELVGECLGRIERHAKRLFVGIPLVGKSTISVEVAVVAGEHEDGVVELAALF